MTEEDPRYIPLETVQQEAEFGFNAFMTAYLFGIALDGELSALLGARMWRARQCDRIEAKKFAKNGLSTGYDSSPLKP